MQHFYTSKGTIVLLLLAALAFVFVGLAMMFYEAGNDKVFRLLFGGAVIIIFGGAALYAGMRLLKKGPALTIATDGITDNSSLLKAGFIPWSDVLGLELNTFRGQQFIAVVVKDPQKYIKRGNFLSQTFMRLNQKWYDSAVQISLNTIDAEHVDVFELMQKKFSEFKA